MARTELDLNAAMTLQFGWLSDREKEIASHAATHGAATHARSTGGPGGRLDTPTLVPDGKTLPTVRVADVGHAAGFVTINQRDFDPAIHTRWADPVDAQPSTETR